ncbi:MAG: undecaprenyl-diphosphate phosphatase [Gammaproteobacteria bacterium]
MDFIHAVILALVQGITEFLPISSSAHLILLPYLFGWTDQGLIYDLAAHLGTLLAVVLYFRHDLLRIISGGWQSISGQGTNDDGQLFWYLIIGSIPVGLAGLILYSIVSESFRAPLLIAATNLVFAGLLFWADRAGRQLRSIHIINLRDALLIGASQILALIPGVSRSGVTITAGLALGLTRQAAARFSFLLSIPVTLMASSYGFYRLLTVEVNADIGSFFLVTVLSFIGAYLAIHFFLKLLDQFGMLPYVIYRLLLGVVLIAIFV